MIVAKAILRGAAACTMLVLAVAAGCAEVGYQRVRIGETAGKKIKRVLPAGAEINAYGYSYHSEALFVDEETAITVIVDDDNVAEAKAYVRATRENWWFAKVRRLAVLVELSGAAENEPIGPIVQDIIDQLRRRHPMREVQIASRLTAAGLVRALEAMAVTPRAAATQDLAEILDKLPAAAGKATARYRHGTWRIKYRVRQKIDRDGGKDKDEPER